jgi:chromate reductase
MSASPGSSGGKRGLVHLRAVIEEIGGTVIPQQLAISNAYNAFDDQGKLKDPKLKNELRGLVTASLSK